MAAALKPIYTAATAEQAEQELAEFEAQWGSRYPMIGRSWRNNWARVIPFFQFPEALKNIEKKWTMPIREWKRALQQFAIVFEGRMPLP